MNKNNILTSFLIIVCLFSLLLVATHLLTTNTSAFGQKSSEQLLTSDQTATISKSSARLLQSDWPPARRPIAFAPNKGQIKDSDVKFQASNAGGGIFFKLGEFHLVISEHTPNSRTNNEDHLLQAEENVLNEKPPFELKVRYQNFNKDAPIVGTNPLPGKMNYFLGNEPSDWVTDVETYDSIMYQDFYPGINLLVSGKDGQVKTSFIVAANANPSVIQWGYQGAKDISLDDQGNLLVSVIRESDTLTVKEKAPIAWQVIEGETKWIPVTFAIDSDKVTFILPNGYDQSAELVIDPTIEWATYLGNNGTDYGQAIAQDSSGNIVIGGYSSTSYYPVTANKYQARAGSFDYVISKLDPTGTTLLYSTFLGGTGSEGVTGLVLDAQDNYIISGSTNSTNFPIVNGIATFAGGQEDIIVAKLNAAGNQLLFSSYLGGDQDDDAERVAVGSDGMIYVVGRINSSNFPTTANAYDTAWYPGYDTNVTPNNPLDDIGVAKFDPTKTGLASLVYSTFLGGPNGDEGFDIAVDSNNKVYVIGYTYSSGTTFPIVNPIQATRSSSAEIVLAVFDMSKSGTASLEMSTYLGGNGRDFGYGMDIDNSGNVYVTGVTQSTNLATEGAFQVAFGGGYDSFAMKVDTINKEVVYTTYLGGVGNEYGNDIAVDNSGKVYVVGYSTGADFPTMNPVQTRPTETCGTSPCQDAFVSILSSTGSALLFGTYLGGGGNDIANGVDVQVNGDASYVIGTTFSGDFPATVGSYDTSNTQANTQPDIFIVKFDAIAPPIDPQLFWSAEGNLADTWFGFSVDTAGDLNGDGYKDLIVGAPHYSNGEIEEGAVFVYYYHQNIAGFPATPDLTLESNKPHAHFGWSVSSAGNVDHLYGDDLIVGAVDWGELTDPYPGEGRAFIYLSTGTGGLSQTPAWSVAGNQAHASLGYVVGTAGYVNNDDFSDVFVGAPNYDNGNTDEGAVYVYHGSSSGPSTAPNWTMEGGQDYAYFGLSAHRAEVNGDAFNDLMVGAPNASTSTTLAGEGRVYLYPGSADGLLTSAIWTVAGNQQNAHFGEAVSSGDLNGDGRNDVMIGAPDYDQGETDEGAAFVYLNSAGGVATQPSWTGESNQAGAHYGISVASAEDMDQDGKDDLLVGANQYMTAYEGEGKVFLYYGVAGTVGIDSTRGWSVEGGQAYANFGYAIRGVGDVNGDGKDEILIGSHQMDHDQMTLDRVDEGYAFLYGIQ